MSLATVHSWSRSPNSNSVSAGIICGQWLYETIQTVVYDSDHGSGRYSYICMYHVRKFIFTI
jgi:hypothetical protein